VEEPLDEREQAWLLQLARQSVIAATEGRVLRVPAPSARLCQPAGVFVSLHKHSLLRGCIGQIHSREPLYRAVIESATSAALYDPRFPPVSEDELDEVEIEISVLSPLTDLDYREAERQIVIGRDGLYVSQGRNHGVLLPQVAERFGWDAREFLEETCVKAGLSRNAWCSGAHLQKFSAQIFSEKRAGDYSSST